MKRIVLIALIVGALAVLVMIGVGADAGVAAGGDAAIEAALRHVGGGTVIETEVGDDGAAYEVEVRLADGSQVEVELNHNLDVIATERDDIGHNDVDDVADDD